MQPPSRSQGRIIEQLIILDSNVPDPRHQRVYGCQQILHESPCLSLMFLTAHHRAQPKGPQRRSVPRLTRLESH